jgi:ABC-type Fe2+-enterobactin transport system substrate-binding protein
MEEVENQLKQRIIKYPNKQIRSDKQQLAFYTGYEKRLQAIVIKHEQKTEELKQQLQDIQSTKHEYQNKVTDSNQKEETERLNKYRKIIQEEEPKQDYIPKATNYLTFVR